jgi:hypothetical protein
MSLRHRLCVWELTEEGWGNGIHSLVGALSAQHGCYQKLKRALEVQLAVNVRIASYEDPIDRIRTASLGREIFLHDERLLQGFSISIAQR